MVGREGDEKTSWRNVWMSILIMEFSLRTQLLHDQLLQPVGRYQFFKSFRVAASVLAVGCPNNTELKGRTKSQVNKRKILMAD